MSNAHPDGAAVGTDALQQHFEGAPVGMLLLAGDRASSGERDDVLDHRPRARDPRRLSFRRFLSTDAPLDLEDRIFEEAGARRAVGRRGRHSHLDRGYQPHARHHHAGGVVRPVRHVVTVFEMGNRRWIEAEVEPAGAELAALSAVAVATGSSTDSDEMLRAAAREIVKGLEGCLLDPPARRMGTGAPPRRGVPS